MSSGSEQVNMKCLSYCKWHLQPTTNQNGWIERGEKNAEGNIKILVYSGQTYISVIPIQRQQYTNKYPKEHNSTSKAPNKIRHDSISEAPNQIKQLRTIGSGNSYLYPGQLQKGLKRNLLDCRRRWTHWAGVDYLAKQPKRHFASPLAWSWQFQCTCPHSPE